MVSNADLAPGDHSPAQRAAAGDTGLSGDHRMLANPDIVRNLHQVVDFDAASDASVIQRAAVNCGISSNFHIVGNLDRADLREFEVVAFTENVAEAVRADHSAGVNLHPIPKRTPA